MFLIANIGQIIAVIVVLGVVLSLGLAAMWTTFARDEVKLKALTPVMQDGKKKRPSVNLTMGEKVWVLMDHEAHQMTVSKAMEDGCFELTCPKATANAAYFCDHFSDSQATRLKIPRGCWCITSFTSTPVTPVVTKQNLGVKMSAGDLFAGDDMFDTLQQIFWSRYYLNLRQSGSCLADTVILPNVPSDPTATSGVESQPLTAEDPNQPVPDYKMECASDIVPSSCDSSSSSNYDSSSCCGSDSNSNSNDSGSGGGDTSGSCDTNGSCGCG